MTQRFLIAMVPCLLLACTMDDHDTTAPDARPWDGKVRVHGALRAMMHEGQTGAMVTLDSMLPNPHLYAVGALADLSGEVTIGGGKAYLSYPEAEGRTEVTTRSAAGAALLVSAVVPSWQSVSTRHAIRFEELDEEIARLAAAAGMSLDRRFPFLLEGDFEDLHWHVIDGSRLTAGGASHEDHGAASIKTKRDRA